MSFDPVLIFQESRDRLVDSLLDVCLELTRCKVIEEDMGEVVLRQYKQVSTYFRQRWLSQSDQPPVIDDLTIMWFGYPL